MGGKGSGGRNRKPAWMHLQSNSFRSDRHGDRKAAQAELDRQKAMKYGRGSTVASGSAAGVLRFQTSGAVALQPDVPDPPADVLVGLGERGRAIVLELWAAYTDWDAARLVVLHELGACADALAGELEPRLRLAMRRSYGQLHRQLGLKD